MERIVLARSLPRLSLNSELVGESYEASTLAAAQVVVLGTGKRSLETKVKALEAKFPGVAKGVVKFSTPLAHLINAGARARAAIHGLHVLCDAGCMCTLLSCGSMC